MFQCEIYWCPIISLFRRDSNTPLSDHFSSAEKAPAGRLNKFNFIITNGPEVSCCTVVTRYLPRSTFDQVVASSGDAINEYAAITVAPHHSESFKTFVSALSTNNAVAELIRKNGMVEYLVPNHNGMTLFYGRVDDIHDNICSVEEQARVREEQKQREEQERVLEALRRHEKEEKDRMEAQRVKEKALRAGRLKTNPVPSRSDGRGYLGTLSQSASSSVTMQSAEMKSCSYITNNQDNPEEGEITEEAQRVKQEEDPRMEAQPCLAEDTLMNACSAKQASDVFQGKTFFDGPHCQNGRCSHNHRIVSPIEHGTYLYVCCFLPPYILSLHLTNFLRYYFYR